MFICIYGLSDHTKKNTTHTLWTIIFIHMCVFGVSPTIWYGSWCPASFYSLRSFVIPLVTPVWSIPITYVGLLDFSVILPIWGWVKTYFTIFWGNERPFNTYFNVHQGTWVLISSHMLHGAGIWNPTFALVQNHSQSFFVFIYQHHGLHMVYIPILSHYIPYKSR